MTVIVTEAHLRTALYVIRSLGRKGIKVICVSEEEKGIGLISKYCWKRKIVPSPKRDPDGYLQEIEGLVEEYAVRVIIPIHENSLFLFSQPEVREKFKDVKIPIPNYSILQKAADKGELIKIASSLGIPVPRTYFIDDIAELEEVTTEIKYPAIIKVRLEKNVNPGPNNRYKKVYNPTECIEWYKTLHEKQPFPLIQEIIKGYGCGFFALFGKKGKLIASTGHRRIREQFADGGPSTFCESYYHPKIWEYGEKLLTHLGWSGVAMVEFKMDHRNGEPTLMEINPRFWGTTPVAILSGVDFPYLLYKIALGEEISDKYTFATGVKLRFLKEDIRAFIRDFKKGRDIFRKINLLSHFLLDLLNPFVKEGIISLDDIGPSIFYLTGRCPSWVLSNYDKEAI